MREFVANVDRDLLRAAGDSEHEKYRRTTYSVFDGPAIFRDGTAVAWTARTRPEILTTLPVPAELGAAAAAAAPERFEGQVATAFARSLGDHTGRSEAEVLDVLCAAGGRSGDDRAQFVAARRMLVPDDQLGRADNVDAHRAGILVSYAMSDEFNRQLQERETRDPGLSAEAIGSAVAEAGVRMRDELGLGPTPATEQDDPALRAAMNAARVPEGGVRSADSTTDGTSRTARPPGSAQRRGSDGQAF